jgi:hypothetical protein
MCECLATEGGGMWLCESCAPEWKEFEAWRASKVSDAPIDFGPAPAPAPRRAEPPQGDGLPTMASLWGAAPDAKLNRLDDGEREGGK